MANRVSFAVSATPIETLTDANSGTHDVLAGEVNKVLGGSGDVLVSDFNDAGTIQGAINGAPFYKTATYAAGGSRLSTQRLGDAFFIKNTGYLYSSSSALGVINPDEDHVLVVLQCNAYSAAGSGVGGFTQFSSAPMIAYFQIARLAPGEAIFIPCASAEITQFGATDGDFIRLNQDDTDGGNGSSKIYVKTVTSSGGTSTYSNAIEFLMTDTSADFA